MKCPTCKEVNLVMTDRQGIEIDYCPECRGVWLDRGELDKIIERSAPQPSSVAQDHSYQTRPQSRDRDDYHYKHKKRKTLLGELFDF